MSVNEPTTDMKLKLYTAGSTINSFRAELYLHEKGMDFERVDVDRMDNKHNKPKYLKLNPRGQVPCLHAYGTCVHESVAIMQFLEHMHPEPPLMPKDPADLARMFERIHEYQQMLDPTNFMGGVLFRGYRMPEMQLKELERWDGYLTYDEYMAGDKISLVDIVVFPFISTLADHLKLPIHRMFPRLARWYEMMKMRPSSQSCTEYWAGVAKLPSKEGVDVLGVNVLAV